MKFKITICLLLASLSFTSSGKFSSDECIKSSFGTEIKHNGKFFGLIKNKLRIEKKECILDIHFDNILETHWKVDICREPVHVKVLSKGMHSVHKRSGWCSENDPSDYCETWSDLRKTMQDYGLIFAEGEREVLTTKHGQTFCSFLVLSKYLGEGVLYSKFDKGQDIFNSKKSEIPVTAKIEKKAIKLIPLKSSNNDKTIEEEKKLPSSTEAESHEEMSSKPRF